MIGKKIFSKVVDAREDVEIPRSAAVFVGMLRGLLYGGALLVIGGAALFCISPERLLSGEVSSVAWGVLIVSGSAGLFFPPQVVARRTRLWLLLTLVCQFVMLSTMRQMLGLYPLKFEYSVESADLSKMPLLDKNIVSKLLPPGSNNSSRVTIAPVSKFAWKVLKISTGCAIYGLSKRPVILTLTHFSSTM